MTTIPSIIPPKGKMTISTSHLSLIGTILDALSMRKDTWEFDRIFTTSEYDSNQTEYEQLMNDGLIGVSSKSKKVGKVLTVFVRMIYDQRGDFLDHIDTEENTGKIADYIKKMANWHEDISISILGSYSKHKRMKLWGLEDVREYFEPYLHWKNTCKAKPSPEPEVSETKLAPPAPAKTGRSGKTLVTYCIEGEIDGPFFHIYDDAKLTPKIHKMLDFWAEANLHGQTSADTSAGALDRDGKMKEHLEKFLWDTRDTNRVESILGCLGEITRTVRFYQW